jgi:hypothetical protein
VAQDVLIADTLSSDERLSSCLRKSSRKGLSRPDADESQTTVR